MLYEGVVYTVSHFDYSAGSDRFRYALYFTIRLSKARPPEVVGRPRKVSVSKNLSTVARKRVNQKTYFVSSNIVIQPHGS